MGLLYFKNTMESLDKLISDINKNGKLKRIVDIHGIEHVVEAITKKFNKGNKYLFVAYDEDCLVQRDYISGKILCQLNFPGEGWWSLHLSSDNSKLYSLSINLDTEYTHIRE